MSALTISCRLCRAVPAPAPVVGAWPIYLAVVPCFPPCARLDLSWEVLRGEEGCIQATTLVAGEAKSSVMRLDQFLSQLSRARPDNHRVSKGARYQTRQQHRAGIRRRARSRLLAALFFFLANFLPLAPSPFFLIIMIIIFIIII